MIRRAVSRPLAGLPELERQEQTRMVNLYRALGCKVYSLSQYRRANQTPGLPDLLVKHPGRGISFTHELKAKRGRVSKPQEEFRALSERCGDRHVIGGYDAGVAFLKSVGLVAS